MSDNSAIEWTDATWNPLLGCTKVSPGCDGCYAIVNARIREANPNPKIATAYASLVERDAAGQLDWTGRVNLVPDRLDQPLRWRKPRRIFVNSQSDLFHDQVPDEYIAEVFAVMLLAERHTFQLLTKRHGRMRSLLSSPGFRLAVWSEAAALTTLDHTPDKYTDAWPVPNVWLGVSVEDQKRADLRIPALLKTPAAVRFLSCEPLLGPVELVGAVDRDGHRPRLTYWLTGRPGWGEPYPEPTSPAGLLVQDPEVGPRIDWVIAGGESGPGSRPMHPDWPRKLRDQCVAAGVAYHFKQWGEYGQLPKDRADLGVSVANDGTVYQPGDLSYPDGPRYGEALRARHDRAHLTAMYRVGKKFAGRELDGRTWDEFPREAP